MKSIPIFPLEFKWFKNKYVVCNIGILVNRIRKMESFELGKDIDWEGCFFCIVSSMGKSKILSAKVVKRVAQE